MKYSQAIINARKIRRLSPVDALAKQIEEVILNNTPAFLHERILNKLGDLTLDVKYDLTSSEFLEQANTVMIKIDAINNLDVFLHEVMHAIGTTKTDNGYNIGLNKRSNYVIDNEHTLTTNFGYGANEGLNQHYTEGFLPAITNFSEVAECYSFCANIMSSLEKLIGKEKCQDAHFSGKGLDALLTYMQEAFYLKNENKALKFILCLDAYMQVSKTHLAFGISHTYDTQLLLVECYKALISLALRKARHENKEINFSDIVSLEHLKKENSKYFIKNLQSCLIRFFYTEKEYVNHHKPSGFIGLREKSMIDYANMLYKIFFTTGNFNTVSLPEEVKCGEFYNHLLLSCMVYDSTGSICPLFMSDFSKELTVNIFDRNTKFVPNKQSEFVQLVKEVLASRKSVRCGAEIDDGHIIESTKDIDFNLFLIDSAPETYKSILPQVDKEIFKNKKILNKIFDKILTSNFEKIKFIKSLPDDLKQNKIVQKQIKEINSKLEKEHNL